MVYPAPGCSGRARLFDLTSLFRRAGNESERALARAIVSVLSKAGVPAEADEVVPDRFNVVARLAGRGECPPLLLAGHLNRSFCDGRWSTDPLQATLIDGRVRAGAVSDMLGGLAAMVGAVEALAREGPPPGDVVLLATMSHDIKAVGLKYALAGRDDWPRYAVWGDPTDREILIAHGGAVKWRVDLSGRAAHVTRREEGLDVLRVAAALVLALHDGAWTHDPNPILDDLPRGVVGVVQAGAAAGLVTAHAVVSGDVRTVPGMNGATVRQDLERLLQPSRELGIEATVEITAEQRPFLGSASSPLVRALEYATAGATSITTRLPGQAYCSGAADLQANGIDTVVFGPGAFRWQPDESVALDDLVAAAAAYAALPTALHRTASESVALEIVPCAR